MRVLLILIGGIVLSGCVKDMSVKTDVSRVSVVKGSVEIDGRLDESQWQTAESYHLSLSKDNEAAGGELNDNGLVKFLWDDDNLYVGIVFDDGDIVAEGSRDNEMHYRLGDVCEIFLKPPFGSYYWEIYVTPGGNKSFFFIPGRGRLGLPSCFDGFDNDMVFASEVSGTLNEFNDRDERWVCEIAIPRKFDMSSVGREDMKLSSGWTVLIARYNYSVYLDNKELSMYPQLSETSYHKYEEYGMLNLCGVE